MSTPYQQSYHIFNRRPSDEPTLEEFDQPQQIVEDLLRQLTHGPLQMEEVL